MTFARGVPILALLLASILLTGDAFGRVSIVVTALATASLLSDSGMDAAATWLLGGADEAASPAQTLSTLIVLRVCVSIVAVVALIAPQASALAGGGSGLVLVLTCSLAAAAMAYCSAVRISLRVAGAGEVEALLWEKLVGGMLFLLALLLLGSSLADHVWIYPATCLLGCLTVLLGRRLGLAAFAVSDVLRLLRSAAPFMVTTICAAVVWRLPVFLLGAAGNYEAAGFLALASYPILLLSSISVLSAPLLFLRRAQDAREGGGFRSTVAMGGACTVAIWLGYAAVEISGLSLPIDGRALVVLAVFAPVMVPLWLNPQLSAWLRLHVSLWVPTVPALFGAAVGVAVVSVSLNSALSAVVGILAAEYSSLAFYLVLRGRQMKNDAGKV
ncbi:MULTISPECIES: oligosaccharide flippase family protein [Stenotrophomonas]|nr:MULTISPECIES: oligosaccharide flippase family protein [Stenotrophomonas]